MNMETFFTSPTQFAKLFTQENWRREERKYGFTYIDDKTGKEYGGLKAIEAFYSDIKNNLIKWSSDKTSIYYMTKQYWYMFTKDKTRPTLIVMTRYNNKTWERDDDWANLHSVIDICKQWLEQPEQKTKRVALFNSK